MKLFRRFLMVLLPLILMGGAFLFFPKIRPDTSEYRTLRKTDFAQGIEISKKAGVKEISGYINVLYEPGFNTLDVGKLRIAYRDKTATGIGPWSGYGGGLSFGHSQVPLLIDPPRKDSAMPNKAPAPFSPTKPSSPTGPPTTPASETYDLPGGTRLDLFGTSFDFENGEVVIDGQTFSTIDKPMLIVLREDFTIELAEELKSSVMPDDVIVP